jgi:hypothetical protein
VERENGEFSRPRMWKESALAATNRWVFYLDSDRIVPLDFLDRCRRVLCERPNTLIFPKWHRKLRSDLTTPHLRDIREDPEGNEDLFHHQDLRVLDPGDGVGRKNPWSGCVVAPRACLSLPDEQFRGWRFADLDLYRSCLAAGVGVYSMNCGDIHLNHEYEVNRDKIKAMHVLNGIKYHRKWGLEMSSLLLEQWRELGSNFKSLS